MKTKHDKSSNGSETEQDRGSGKHNKSNSDLDEKDNYESHSSRSRSRSRSRKSNEKSGSKSDKVDHDVLSVYIGNVDYTLTEEELRNCFIGCGDIVRVTIIKNMRTGHPKGAAFIEFTDKDGVNAAMQLNGKELKSRPLIVTSKKPRPDRPKSSSRTSLPPRHSSSRSSRYDYDYSSRSDHFRGSRTSNGGPSSRPMPRRLPPMMPPMRSMQPRYDPYRRPPPEFYGDPYGMMQRPGPPMYPGKMHGRPPMPNRPPPRYHPYSYRK